VQINDCGRKIVTNNIHSYLQSKIVFFVSNIHTQQRRIWLSRHGQSVFNTTGQLGGDSGLSELGQKYAKKLGEWCADKTANLMVWTSTLVRTIQTAQHIPQGPDRVRLRALDEINAGDFDGWTYEQIKEKHPEEFRLRSQDKLNYRYPRGESYVDLIARLEPVIFELERTRGPILVVAHQAVLRCLYGYFMNKDPTEVPFLSIPLHQVIELNPKAYGCAENRIKLID